MTPPQAAAPQPMTGHQILPSPFVVALLNRYLSENDVFLDLGCGPGVYRTVTHGRYIGIDYTDAPYYPDCPRNVDIVAEGSKLALRSNCIDLIMLKSAFFQFPDPMGALKEFQRVLKPGGRILLFDYNRRTQQRLEKGEQAKRPCWTQWQLKTLVEEAGFVDAELLLPTSWQLPVPLRLPFLIAQEWLGTWAILTAVKKSQD